MFKQSRIGLLRTRVVSVKQLAEGIRSYELQGEDLPRFAAGSHLDAHLPNGLIRQYSLCNDPDEKGRYVIAVLREVDGRGGSECMYTHVNAGDELMVSEPKNQFPLIHDQGRLHFFAGGIGITPIMAMVAACVRHRIDFHLHYCVRSRARAAFLDRIQSSLESEQFSLYVDDEGVRPDFETLLARATPGEHVYYCGPPGFMDCLAEATKHWPEGSVHFERFSAGAEQEALLSSAENSTFEVQIASTGATYTVAADESIAEVLRRHGVQIDTSCEEGYCGTCMTRYTGGQPEHRDTVLDETNRKNYVMICCARASENPLVLDL